MGIGLSIAVGTDATTGMVPSALDSAMPLAGLVALLDMQIGEVAFGGVGSGLYGMLVFVVLTVFIAGLMVGRTPEWLGKKIERREVQYAMLAVLLFPAAILVPAAFAVVTPAATASVGNGGAHGFTEILYAFTSTAASNGSAFAGLAANTPFYNVATGIAMLLGRYGVAVPTLALAGALAARPRNLQTSSGSFDTSAPLFVALLVGVVVVVGALTFCPPTCWAPSSTSCSSPRARPSDSHVRRARAAAWNPQFCHADMFVRDLGRSSRSPGVGRRVMLLTGLCRVRAQMDDHPAPTKIEQYGVPPPSG